MIEASDSEEYFEAFTETIIQAQDPLSDGTSISAFDGESRMADYKLDVQRGINRALVAKANALEKQVKHLNEAEKIQQEIVQSLRNTVQEQKGNQKIMEDEMNRLTKEKWALDAENCRIAEEKAKLERERKTTSLAMDTLQKQLDGLAEQLEQEIENNKKLTKTNQEARMESLRKTREAADELPL